jgi:hypothetical protein
LLVALALNVLPDAAVAGSCKHGNEALGSIKGWEFRLAEWGITRLVSKRVTAQVQSKWVPQRSCGGKDRAEILGKEVKRCMNL